MAHKLDETPVLDQSVIDQVGAALGIPVHDAAYVTSGAAGNIFRLRTGTEGVDAGTVIVKTARPDRPAAFEGEAAGLRLIASTHTVPVPQVLAVAPHFLVLQDLGTNDSKPTPEQWEALGEQVGHLNTFAGPHFGYLGSEGMDDVESIPSANSAETAAPASGEDWVEFFANNRVRCHYNLGKNAEILTAEDRAGIENIIAKIGPTVPPTAPALCHGDLWRENVYLGADGILYLIDPAVDFTHPEADLAVSQMYGVFPPEFYQGYRKAKPLSPEWTERLPLYQLKELLLMIAQFGHEDSLKKLRENIAKYQ